MQSSEWSGVTEKLMRYCYLPFSSMSLRSCNISRNRIRKIRDNCNTEFEKHWQCLEKNNQVRLSHPVPLLPPLNSLSISLPVLPSLPDRRDSIELVSP